MNARIFPSVIILLSFGASIVYACHGDIRKCIYFLAAAVLNAAVVF